VVGIFARDCAAAAVTEAKKGGTTKDAVLHIETEEIDKMNIFKACDVQD
jgi:hypothetical protein